MAIARWRETERREGVAIRKWHKFFTRVAETYVFDFPLSEEEFSELLLRETFFRMRFQSWLSRGAEPNKRPLLVINGRQSGGFSIKSLDIISQETFLKEHPEGLDAYMASTLNARVHSAEKVGNVLEKNRINIYGREDFREGDFPVGVIYLVQSPHERLFFTNTMQRVVEVSGRAIYPATGNTLLKKNYDRKTRTSFISWVEDETKRCYVQCLEPVLTVKEVKQITELNLFEQRSEDISEKGFLVRDGEGKIWWGCHLGAVVAYFKKKKYEVADEVRRNLSAYTYQKERVEFTEGLTIERIDNFQFLTDVSNGKYEEASPGS